MNNAFRGVLPSTKLILVPVEKAFSLPGAATGGARVRPAAFPLPSRVKRHSTVMMSNAIVAVVGLPFGWDSDVHPSLDALPTTTRIGPHSASAARGNLVADNLMAGAPYCV